MGFIKSMRTTPIGEIARALHLHPDLLYNDEKVHSQDRKDLAALGASIESSGDLAGVPEAADTAESKKEIVFVRWYVVCLISTLKVRCAE